jgi:hypothetical protein
VNRRAAAQEFTPLRYLPFELRRDGIGHAGDAFQMPRNV